MSNPLGTSNFTYEELQILYSVFSASHMHCESFHMGHTEMETKRKLPPYLQEIVYIDFILF